MSTEKTLLLVGDPHAHPDHPNDRFEWLGEFWIDSQADELICMGDLADMPSLSSYDKGKRSHEGKRVIKDIAVTIDAQEKLFKARNKYNERARSFKKRQHQGKTVLLGGNHDFRRIERATNDDSMWDGLLTIDSLRYNEFFDVVVPFLRPYKTQGIGFQHYWTNGSLDQPVSSVNQTRALLEKLKTSVVQGHNHFFEYTKDVNAFGEPMFAMSAGCYFDFPVDYATPKLQSLWDRCVILLKGIKNGFYQDIEKVSLETLRSVYSKAAL